MTPTVLALLLIERHPRALVLAFLALAALALAGGGFQVGHSYEDWIDRDDPAWRDYRAMADEFGAADTVIAAFPRARLNAANVAGYYALLDDLRARPGVIELFDPAELFLGADAFTPPQAANVEDLRAMLATDTPDWRNVLVARDLSLLSPLLLLDPAQRGTHAGVLAELSRGLAALDLAPLLAGTVVFAETLKEAIAADLVRVVCLLVLSSALLLLYFFRDPIACLVVFAGIALSVVYSLALCALIGLSVNLLTLLLVPLVFCVSLTTAIHLFARREDGVWRLRTAYPQVVRPLAIATVTTALGCLALANAPQSIIARMGLAMPAAVCFTFLTSMLFVPAMLAVLGRLARAPVVVLRSGIPPRTLRRAGSALLAVLSVAAACSLPSLTREPDAFHFFADDAPLVQAYRSIEARISGLLVVDLVIRSTQGAVDGSPRREQIEHFLADLRTMPAVTTVVSGYALLRLGAAAPPALGTAFFNAERSATRVSLRLRNTGGQPYAALAAEIRARWARLAPAGLTLTLTGVIPLILDAQDRLLRMQGLTLLAGLGVACVLLLPFFRSPWLIALAGVATFVPLLITAGAMVWLSIPLNAINLFVGSVILGLVVDDAIYLLHAYRETGDIDAALAEVGSALGITSVSVGLAFASLAFSQLVPIRQFGLLSAIAVACAWGVDVCLVPTLVEWRRRPA